MELLWRLPTAADMPMVLAWRRRPDVTRHMYTDVADDLDAQLRWHAAIQQDDTRRDWIVNVDGEDVGFLSLTSISSRDNRCDWAYYLASDSVRGRGLGKALEVNVLEYVFESLHLNKLCCEVLATNEFVVTLHERFGSSVEGLRRQQVRKDGEYLDIVVMGILREDYERDVRGKYDDVVRATIEDASTSRDGGS